MIICNRLFFRDYRQVTSLTKRLPKYAYDYLKGGIELTCDGCLISVFEHKEFKDWDSLLFLDPITKEVNYNGLYFEDVDKNNKIASLEQSLNMLNRLVSLFDSESIPWKIIIALYRNGNGWEVTWHVLREGLTPFFNPKDIEQNNSSLYLIYSPSSRPKNNKISHHKGPVIINNNDDSLIQAINNDSIEQFYDIIERGFDVNCKDSEGLTPLYYAGYLGRLEMVRALIEKGAVIDVTDRFGNSPLINALYYSNSFSSDLISLFVNNGANLDLMNNYGQTPRIIASNIANDINNDSIDIINSIIGLQLLERESFPR